MGALTPEYELVLMLDPEVPDERRDQLAADARKRIESAGDLKQERSWGLRKMAYEIDQRNEADYRFFRFGQGGNLLDELTHNLKIADGVMRFRIYKVDPRTPVIDPPPPITLMASSPRPGGRGRRDDDREDRGSREPMPAAPEAVTADTPDPATVAEAAAPAGEAAAPEAPAPVQEAPAAETPAADAAAPAPETETPAPEAAPAPEAEAPAPETAPAPEVAPEAAEPAPEAEAAPEAAEPPADES